MIKGRTEALSNTTETEEMQDNETHKSSTVKVETPPKATCKREGGRSDYKNDKGGKINTGTIPLMRKLRGHDKDGDGDTDVDDPCTTILDDAPYAPKKHHRDCH